VSLVAVTGYVWVLSLHVLAAFAVGGPVTLLVLVALAQRRAQTPAERATLDRVAGPAATLFRAGVAATLIFGVWLVLASDTFSLLDGWIIAAFVLWLAIGGLGDRAIGARKRAAERAAERTTDEVPTQGADRAAGADDEGAEQPPPVLWPELGAAAATMAALALMIWKPGA
jgi:uncharacterized membrane protein